MQPNPGPSAPLALRHSTELARRVQEWHERNAKQLDQIRQMVAEPLERFGRWLEEHGPQIQTLIEAVEQIDARGKEIEAAWHGAGFGYLVSPLTTVDYLFLTTEAAPGDAEALFEILQAALARPEVMEQINAALDSADVLSDIPRQHLRHGLEHLAAGEAVHAWPPLIIGLEGAFADVAIREGIAVRVGNHVHLADADGNPLSKKVPSVEGVAGMVFSNEDVDFNDFLVRWVYGGDGDPFRHGVAQEGINERVICLGVAVVGWLNCFVTPDMPSLLGDAMRREILIRAGLDDEEGAAPLRT